MIWFSYHLGRVKFLQPTHISTSNIRTVYGQLCSAIIGLELPAPLISIVSRVCHGLQESYILSNRISVSLESLFSNVDSAIALQSDLCNSLPPANPDNSKVKMVLEERFLRIIMKVPENDAGIIFPFLHSEILPLDSNQKELCW